MERSVETSEQNVPLTEWNRSCVPGLPHSEQKRACIYIYIQFFFLKMCFVSFCLFDIIYLLYAFENLSLRNQVRKLKFGHWYSLPAWQPFIELTNCIFFSDGQMSLGFKLQSSLEWKLASFQETFSFLMLSLKFRRPE